MRVRDPETGKIVEPGDVLDIDGRKHPKLVERLEGYGFERIEEPKPAKPKAKPKAAPKAKTTDDE